MLRPIGGRGIFQALLLSVFAASTPGTRPSAESFRVLSSTLLTVRTPSWPLPCLPPHPTLPTTACGQWGRPLTCAPFLCCIQGQGALSERLRSFSMQDLTTIRGDGAPAPSSPPPPGSGRASGKHGQPKMSRSASESAGSSGRCRSAFWLFHFTGLAFTERAPVHHAACSPELPSTQMPIGSCQASQEAEHHSGQEARLAWGPC